MQGLGVSEEHAAGERSLAQRGCKRLPGLADPWPHWRRRGWAEPNAQVIQTPRELFGGKGAGPGCFDLRLG